jgi:hypothetical protein
MKTFLPWLLAVIAAGGAVFFYNGNQTKSAELAKLQTRVQELETVFAENEELKKNQIAPEELARLKESKDELLRLRNQVRQLTTEKTQLGQQAQAAKTAADQAQAQAQALVQSQTQVLARAQEQAQTLTANACISNLRQIEAAKHQWALEQQKPVGSTATEKDLAAYFAGQVLPICPGGGKYTLGNVGAGPTCSVANHAVPSQ